MLLGGNAITAEIDFKELKTWCEECYEYWFNRGLIDEVGWLAIWNGNSLRRCYRCVRGSIPGRPPLFWFCSDDQAHLEEHLNEKGERICRTCSRGHHDHHNGHDCKVVLDTYNQCMCYVGANFNQE